MCIRDRFWGRCRTGHYRCYCSCKSQNKSSADICLHSFAFCYTTVFRRAPLAISKEQQHGIVATLTYLHIFSVRHGRVAVLDILHYPPAGKKCETKENNECAGFHRGNSSGCSYFCAVSLPGAGNDTTMPHLSGFIQPFHQSASSLRIQISPGCKKPDRNFHRAVYYGNDRYSVYFWH